MKRTLVTSLVLTFLVLCSGCCSSYNRFRSDVPLDWGARPWTSARPNTAPDQFQFAIMADRAGGIRPGVFEKGVECLNSLQPEFVMCIGDLIEGDAKTVELLDGEWDEFDAIVQELDMPFFYVPGNHDLGKAELPAETKLAKWRERYGRSYYHFMYRGVLFLCMNSEDSDGGQVSDAQLEYIHDTLKTHKNARWTFIFMHKPLWTPNWEAQWKLVEPLLKGRSYTVFAGHTHDFEKCVRDGRAHYILATTGGSSKLRGVEEGEFDGVVWVTMKHDGPRIVNLKLDGFLPDDFRMSQPAK